MKRRDFARQAASLGLVAAGTSWQRLLGAPLPTQEIRGHVVCETVDMRHSKCFGTVLCYDGYDWG